MAKAREDLVSLIPGEVDTSEQLTSSNEPYSLKDYLLFFPDLLIGGGQDLAASVLGNVKGIAEGVTSENYGTQEGVREAEKSAADFMQKYGAKPASRATSDFKQSIAEYLATKGYDKFAVMDPRFFTTPLPGPASTRFATIKSAEAADDFLEDQYRKKSEGEGGQAAQMLRSVLPPRLDIFQGAKSQTFDKKSAEVFEKAEQKILTENPDISRYDLNIKAWKETADAVKQGELEFPTFRGVDNQLRQEVPDTGFTFILPFTTYQKPRDKRRYYDEEVRLPEGMGDPYKIKNLDELIDFPELFKAYSNLQKDKVRFIDKGTFDSDNPFAERNFFRDSTLTSARNFDTGDISIAPIREDSVDMYPVAPFEKNPSPEGMYKSILNHEIQHAIQSAEGFATGTNDKSIKRDLLSLSNALKEKKQKILKEIKDKNKKVLTAGGSKQKVREEEKTKNKKRLKQIDVIDDLIKQTEIQNKFLKEDRDPIYSLNLGEIESRIVEERQNLSMPERLENFPLKRFFDKKGASFVFDNETARFMFRDFDDKQKPKYGLSLFKEDFPILSNIARRDLIKDELFTSLAEKKRRDKNLTNFIIQQLSPRQAKDLGFDKD